MRYFQTTLLLILFLACTETVNVNNDLISEKLVATAQEDLSLFDGTFVPKGTKAYELGNRLRLELPEGFYFVGSQVDLNGNSKIVSTQSFTITCTCDKGTGGCSPWSQGSSWGCTADSNCTKCTGTRTEDPEMLTTGTIITSGDVINFREPLEIIQPEDVINYPSAYREMFEVEEIYNELTDALSMFLTDEDLALLANMSSDASMPDGISKIYLKFMGRIILINASKSISIAARVSQVTGSSCSCAQGSGCVLDTMWTPKGTITYCDALGCQSCSLTIEE